MEASTSVEYVPVNVPGAEKIKSKATGPRPGEEGSYVAVYTWLPNRDTTLADKPAAIGADFVSIASAMRKRDEDGFYISRNRDFRLHHTPAHEQDDCNIQLLVDDMTSVHTDQSRDGHNLTSTERSIHRTIEVRDFPELTQRLDWAVGLVAKMTQE